MTEQPEWEIPASAQPKAAEVAFELDRALSSVVSLRSEIPADAFTAPVLGTERAGNGVLIRPDGLTLTIGYLIAEAETVWLVSNAERAAAAHVVGYDHETGLGLVQALGTLGVPPLDLGSSAAVQVDDSVIVAGHGGQRHALNATVASQREFAGYWEYLLDEAIFTAPPHPNWGGAALIGSDGTLLGIGSLFVRQAGGEENMLDGNMIVPIDLLKPIINDLMQFGRTAKPPRPWLGIYTAESEDALVIAGLAAGGPAEQADLRPGDIVLEVAGEPVRELATMFRSIWSLGPAGVEVPLTVRRDGETLNLRLRSADRAEFLKPPRLH
jgi:S1-C subfamily serine protease